MAATNSIGETRPDPRAWDEKRVEKLGAALVTAANSARIGLAVVVIELPEPRVVYVTDVGAEIIGHSRAAILNQPAVAFLTPEERDVHSAGGSLRTDVPPSLRNFETTVLTANRRRVAVEVSMAPMELDGDHIVVVFFRDISERREIESRLIRTDRLAALGTLLAGIVHEMNNPLAYVLLGIDQALARLDGIASQPDAVDRLREILDEVRQGATRVAAVVGQLRATSRPDAKEHGVVDVAQVLRSALRVAGNEIRHRARLVTLLDEMPAIDGSAQRLEQVFLNLLVNATQALPEGRPENEISVSLRASPGDTMTIEIRDNGYGIAPEILPRIFDPFFTTKAVGVGMGLGLSICHGIIAAHGGTIDVESTPGHGSRFRVVLPARRSGSQGRAPSTRSGPIPASPGRRRRVLVVDDEPALGAMIQRMLKDDFDVDAVTDGRQGLARLCAGAADYDTILCDIMMPDLTGMDLHATVAERYPGVERRFVFMTGGAFTPRAAKFLATVCNPRLDKPFDLATLRATVDRRI